MRRLLLAVLAGAVAGALIAVGVVVAADQLNPAPNALGFNEIASNGNVQGRLYTGSPDAEAALVADEQSRLDYVRTVTSAAEWHFDAAADPYRLATGDRTTLVLTPRDAAYTVDDLSALLADDLRVLADGSLLLLDSVVVLEGATLSIRSDAGEARTILLDSTAESFVSILSLGGTLDVTGSVTAPVTIASWNSAAAVTDTVTSDGRAYVRAIGGAVTLG